MVVVVVTLAFVVVVAVAVVVVVGCSCIMYCCFVPVSPDDYPEVFGKI